MRAIAGYEGGVNFLMQYGIKEDGAVYKRFKEKSQYGYVWGKWDRDNSKMVDPKNLPLSIPAGFGNAYRIEQHFKLPSY